MWPRIAVVLSLLSSVSPVSAGEDKSPEPEAARVQRLIERLESPKFSERQAASAELRKIGEAALPALRGAVRRGAGLELRRRAESLLGAIKQDNLDRLIKDATRAEIVDKDFKKAAGIWNRVIDFGKHGSVNDKATSENTPLLADAYLRRARVQKKLGDPIAAARDYNRAVDYASSRPVKRQQIEVEIAELIAAEVKKLGGQVKRLPYPKDRTTFAIDLTGTKASDADLNLLAEARGMSSVDLSFTRVTDRGVARLTGLKELYTLDLAGTKVTDEVITPLRKMAQLHSINLAHTGVTDRGIARLVHGKRLTLCRAAVGQKAQFRVFQRYDNGQATLNYLMIGDCYYGNYLPGKQDQHRLVTTYYHRDGPVGQVMRKLEWFKPASLLDYPSDARLPASLVGLLSPMNSLPDRALLGLWTEPAVGVVRLNAGTHAAYGRPLQYIDFYNSTPELKAFSLPTPGRQTYFGYIQEARQRGGIVRVIEGDERVALAKKSPKHFYAALFVDITRNDLRDINTKLMTKEALADMFATVKDSGLVCFHTSHRYHDLIPPIVDAAKALGLFARVAKDAGNASGRDTYHFGSEWVMIARRPEHLQHLTGTEANGPKWSVIAGTGKHLWRDGQAQDLRPLARSLLRK